MTLNQLQKWTPLNEAAQSGDVDKVRELLKGGKYDVNCTARAGWTPLHEAAAMGHMGVLRVLISEFEANVNAYTNYGSTPFDLAVSNYREDVALALMIATQMVAHHTYTLHARKVGLA